MSLPSTHLGSCGFGAHASGRPALEKAIAIVAKHFAVPHRKAGRAQANSLVKQRYYNYTITNGTSCLVDGAKRDTLVWPGDMFTSGPSIAYSTYNMDAIKNSMESLLLLQLSNGLLPYVGVPFFSIINAVSFTYHLHNLIGMYNYYHYTGDEAWISQYWDQFKLGVDWSLSNIDSTGLMDVTASADWLRSGMGGHNIEANAILYYVLNLGVELAGVLDDGDAATQYEEAAATLKVAANEILWSDSLGFYVDNETTTMAPQDGNSFAGMPLFSLTFLFIATLIVVNSPGQPDTEFVARLYHFQQPESEMGNLRCPCTRVCLDASDHFTFCRWIRAGSALCCWQRSISAGSDEDRVGRLYA